MDFFLLLLFCCLIVNIITVSYSYIYENLSNKTQYLIS